ncbi:zinc transporter ZIP3-like [Macrobrachium nipponense]|uniref:zinc transporter ZIP3-like n=1 Tax=Macrobrachium nipponense TaxID=159736 RepID=UPI0030C8B5EF
MLSLEGHKAVALTVMFVITFSISMLPLAVRKAFKKYLSHSYTQTTRRGRQQSLKYSILTFNILEFLWAPFIRWNAVETEHSYQSYINTGLSGCLCFGAGVLMSIVFLHMTPETQESFEYAIEMGYLEHTHYPVADAVICLGFFIVYFIEESVHFGIDRYHERKQKAGSMKLTTLGCPTVDEAKIKAQKMRAERKSSEIRESFVSRRSVAGLAVYASANGYVNEGFEHDRDGESVTRGSVPKPNKPVITGNVSLIGTAIVIVALSFHGLMEGMSVGLESDSQDVWVLFGALSAHKIFLAFSMSMEMLEVGVSMKPFLLSMTMFSLASPIGGLIGALVSAYTAELETPASVLAPAFLQAISAGTILYVTFCEVLERERAKHGNGHLKLFALALGFSVMAGLEAVGGHDHHHSDDTTTPDLVTPSMW